MKQLIPLKIKRIIKVGFSDLQDFGWSIALVKVNCIFTDDSLDSVKFKNRMILKYLEKRYSYIIKKYENKEESEDNTKDAEQLPIWVMWWQGSSEMPDIIKMCHQSRIRAAGKHPVIVLTQENIHDYIEFPDYIWKQFSDGKLRMQHLADMIRMQLIQRYGGLWLDASIYCTSVIPEEVFQMPLFTLKGENDPYFVSNNQWSTFVIGGFPNNILSCFLNDFFMEYCRKEKRFIDYYMFDCAIALAYRCIPTITSEIDRMPKASGDCYWLSSKLHQDVTEELLDEFCKQSTLFQKIAWRKFVDYNKGQENLFSVLLEREMSNESKS